MLTTSPTLTNCDLQEQSEEFWQQGLHNILTDDFEEAHASLLMPFLSVETEREEELLQSSLLHFLQVSADEQARVGMVKNVYKIIRITQDLFPNYLNNLLHLIILATQFDDYDPEMLTDRGLLLLLTNAAIDEIEQVKMHQAIQQALNRSCSDNLALLPDGYLSELIDTYFQKATDLPTAISIVYSSSAVLAQKYKVFDVQVNLLEICLEHCPEILRFDILSSLATAASALQDHDRSIGYAQAMQQECLKHHNELRTLVASQTLLSCLMRAGRWQEILAVVEQHQENIEALLVRGWSEPEHLGSMAIAEYFLNYVSDRPRTNHRLRNGLGEIVAPLVRRKYTDVVSAGNAHPVVGDRTNKVLNIGYIASTLTNHSVGWLSRWLFLHHNKQEFRIFAYNVCVDDQDDFNRQYFATHAHCSRYFDANVANIVEQIQKDQIDILIDLDSLAFSKTYEVLCCRPAPIQVTWLGWDASGCPEIDYFIADPHVLPADAEEYYSAKIWRLPNTYLAVDGFEVGVPTKRREDYNIPANAVVYLCGQNVFKYHPDILRLQMQIIREVPNSYLLMKMRGDRAEMISRCQLVAEEAGVSMDRLRFIEPDADEYEHRANLGLADVVLDTFPYNGATTTLETIWAGVPMVTKVGQSFVARNSYAFLTHAGIAEGIAYTDEEYVKWGIRLGVDSPLRQQVSGKMLQSRSTSPLWNARKFTFEMEDAYRQMWDIYQERQTGMSI
jgi:predicted O-linked N-acetylglucosamine transferase (SPINDLY family)